MKDASAIRSNFAKRRSGEMGKREYNKNLLRKAGRGKTVKATGYLPRIAV
jgi:hypothetical protein